MDEIPDVSTRLLKGLHEKADFLLDNLTLIESIQRQDHDNLIRQETRAEMRDQRLARLESSFEKFTSNRKWQVRVEALAMATAAVIALVVSFAK